MFTPLPDQALITAPLTAATFPLAKDQALRAFDAGAGALEWRLDCLELVQNLFPAAGDSDNAANSHGHNSASSDSKDDPASEKKRARLIATAVANALIDFPPLPVLLTVRSEHEGGNSAFSDVLALELVDCGAAAVDIEFARFVEPPCGMTNKKVQPADISVGSKKPQQWNKKNYELILERAKKANIQIVASAHNFEFTPDRKALTETFEWLRLSKAPVIKLAVMPMDCMDVGNLISASAEAARKDPKTAVISMSMGDLGKISRVAGRISGSAATFGAVSDEEASAPGQLSIRRLSELFM